MPDPKKGRFLLVASAGWTEEFLAEQPYLGHATAARYPEQLEA
jgi:hypothetical protein